MPSGTAVEVREDASAIEQYMAEFAGQKPVGLESVGSDDIALAQIKIDHDHGLFVDGLTGETHEVIDGVLLGVIKQRVLWDPDPENKTGPLCKSTDAISGSPRETFPWVEFKKGSAPEPLGTPEIKCETCTFAQWGSHPKNNTPWCSMQYTFPLVIGSSPDVAGLVTFQRSGVAPTQKYLSGFVRHKIPMFAVRTKLSLNISRKGTVNFSTPVFERGEKITDVAQLRAWGEAYKAIAAIVGNTEIGHDVLIEPTQSTGDAPF